MTNNISGSLPPVVISLSPSILLIPSRPWYVYVSFFFIIILLTLMILNLKIIYAYKWGWGLDILRIINEPTAAAIAYGLDSQPSINRISNLQVRIPLVLKMSYSFSFCSAFNSMFKVSRWNMWVTSLAYFCITESPSPSTPSLSYFPWQWIPRLKLAQCKWCSRIISRDGVVELRCSLFLSTSGIVTMKISSPHLRLSGLSH